ncbi:hypothetical protein M885DRAFT_520889 [Pelagophyceae sp. CCMP2097]|nr:hypothetical protein M885DRAFT_520889 [Pelagophyceae sp. CCMP2097]
MRSAAVLGLACLGGAAARRAGLHTVRIQPGADDTAAIADKELFSEKAAVFAVFQTNERYFSLVEEPTGRLWLFSRDDGPRLSLHPTATLARNFTETLALPRLSPGAALRLVHSRSAAHNFGAVFHGGVVGVGGQDQVAKRLPGQVGVALVLRTKAPIVDFASFAPYTAPAADVVLRGDHAGCVEARRGLQGRCEFDGKLSLAPHRGKLLLYARANTAPMQGGRGVQVSASTDGELKIWGAFQLVSFLDFQNVSAADSNVYFAAVNANPADNSTVVGLFPVHQGVSAYIAMAISCDGVHFSSLRKIYKSRAADSGRTTDHPVDGIVSRGGAVHFYVHRDVPGIAKGNSRIVRLETTMRKLHDYTHAQKDALHNRGLCDEVGEREDSDPVVRTM